MRKREVKYTKRHKVTQQSDLIRFERIQLGARAFVLSIHEMLRKWWSWPLVAGRGKWMKREGGAEHASNQYTGSKAQKAL